MDETYSIKDVAAYFDISISTIRYYDRQGLLPFISKNSSGHREFTRADMGLVKTICCLKDTDMPLKEIKAYIHLCMEGTDTIEQRRLMLVQHKQDILDKQRALQDNLAEIDIKISRYSAPNAKEIIGSQIEYMTTEKEKHHLANPFAE